MGILNFSGKKKYYGIDHKILFLFGYLFYFSSPYIVGSLNIFQGYPGIELYQSFFKKIPQSKLLLYIVVTLSWLPAFYLGHFAFLFVVPYKLPLQKYTATPVTRSVKYIGTLLLIVFLVFAYIGRNSLFAGYASYDEGARGKISTLLVLFNFFLVYQLVTKQILSPAIVVGTLLTALLLLSMGGRMYIMQTILVLLIYKTSFAHKKWKAVQVVLFCTAGFILISFIGIWRIGLGGFSGQKASYSLFAEPVFTWFSTSSYLISNDVPLISFPSNFITSFFNIVPNTIFSLRPYIVSASSMTSGYQSPLGADSIWSTLVINFGTIGSFFFIFITGFMLHFLQHLSSKSRFAAVYYIMVCGLLPFQFFRDGFYIINKQLFFNFLILPGLMLALLQSVIYLQVRMQAKPSLGTASTINN